MAQVTPFQQKIDLDIETYKKKIANIDNTIAVMQNRLAEETVKTQQIIAALQEEKTYYTSVNFKNELVTELSKEGKSVTVDDLVV